jgi:SAM-dependent methyltransferase
MTDHVEMNRRNWDERAAIHARDTTGDYMLDRFRAGEDALPAIEAAELGDISGKRVLHLQCHIGRDTLCLVRRGATVTGLDFSSAALNVAQRLSDETGLKADFVEGTVDQAPDLTPGPFDLVFTTWGTICWLPDVKKWAKVIASVLALGGELYFADAHPGFSVLEEYAGRLVPTYDFQTPPDRPLQFANETTYTGDPTIMSHQPTREWIHSLSAVLGGLIDAGLTITMFREHEVLPWRGLTSLVPASERMWRLPDGVPRIPLSYSVRAKKKARENWGLAWLRATKSGVGPFQTSKSQVSGRAASSGGSSLRRSGRKAPDLCSTPC